MPITAQGPGMNTNMFQWRAEEFNSSKIFKLLIIGIVYEMLHKPWTHLARLCILTCSYCNHDDDTSESKRSMK